MSVDLLRVFDDAALPMPGNQRAAVRQWLVSSLENGPKIEAILDRHATLNREGSCAPTPPPQSNKPERP